MDFNYQNAYVGLITDPNKALAAFSTGNITATDITLIGITSSESGYKVEKDQTQRSSTGKEYVLTWKLTINIPVLTRLAAGVIDSVDGNTMAVVFIDAGLVTVADESGSFPNVPVPSGVKLLVPTRLWITEDEQFGSGQVRPVVITGEKIEASKGALRRDAEILADN